jgi:hypothetical protein
MHLLPARKRGPIANAADRMACTILLLAGAASLLFGQSYYGSIRGNVQDQNAGAVTNATVSLTDESTGLVRQSITGTSGDTFSVR